MSVNRVAILGRLGADPELKTTASGANVCNFTVATTEKWKDKDGQEQERTEWHKVVTWKTLAENCAKYLTKGSMIYACGSLRTRKWEKDGVSHYTTEIHADDVQFLSRANSEKENHEEFPF